MARQAKAAGGLNEVTVLAGQGYFSAAEILACEQAGITALCPKPLTSGATAAGRFGQQDFIYQPQNDTYRCPAGEELVRRCTSVENGLTINRYWFSKCGACALKANCTRGRERRVSPLGTRACH